MIPFSSSAEYTAPVGLQGEFRMKSFVFGVMAFLILSGVTLKPSSGPAST